MMRRLWILGAIVLASAAGLFWISDWEVTSPMPMALQEQKQVDHLEKQIAVEKLLRDHQPEAALKIIRGHEEEINKGTEEGMMWLELFIEASQQLHDTKQLDILYDYFPDVFNQHEDAAIMVADDYVDSRRLNDYHTLRSHWRGREQYLAKWVALDADELLLEERPDEAIQLLRSKRFHGKEELNRLIRLALLTAKERPKEAWQYLTEAYKLDPNNSDVRTYRARLLVSAGKKDLAEAEYIATMQTHPKNLELRDHLADFYIQEKRFADAQNVWKAGLPPPSADFIWTKALFWDRVSLPSTINWKSYTPPNSPMRPYITYLENLPQKTYWDDASFAQIPEGNAYLESQQSAFWLRLIDALQREDESAATNLLQFNPFTETSWAPDLEMALKRILEARSTLQNPTDPNALPTPNPRLETESPFFAELAEYRLNPHKQMPPNLQALLKSDDAYAAAFLHTGWLKAALALQKSDTYPEAIPSWVPYQFTQALFQTADAETALHFAKAQPATPPLQLLIGELMIANHQAEQAIEQLTPLTNEKGDIGFHATWMLSLALMEKGEYAKAKETIDHHPALAKDLIGIETLARIALQKGEEEEADKLYVSIEKRSSEAKSYLARKAFAQKNWKRARRLTQELLKEHPNNPMLLKNLKRISEKEMKSRK